MDFRELIGVDDKSQAIVDKVFLVHLAEIAAGEAGGTAFVPNETCIEAEAVYRRTLRLATETSIETPHVDPVVLENLGHISFIDTLGITMDDARITKDSPGAVKIRGGYYRRRLFTNDKSEE